MNKGTLTLSGVKPHAEQEKPDSCEVLLSFTQDEIKRFKTVYQVEDVATLAKEILISCLSATEDAGGRKVRVGFKVGLKETLRLQRRFGIESKSKIRTFIGKIARAASMRRLKEVADMSTPDAEVAKFLEEVAAPQHDDG